jgi:CheY-like chemotaxis protein
MNERNPLEVLFPGPRRLLLCAMFQQPARWWTLAELAGRAGVQPTTIRQHLAALRQTGVVCEKLESGRAWFQADAGCPVFPELHSIVHKLIARDSVGETILVVEDQPATAQITRILLESWGYRVMEAHCADEALALFEQHGDCIQLLLTDVLMPGLTGPQLANELARRKPALRIVFMSGYPNDRLLESGAAFLAKPFNPSSLSRTIRRELDRPAARSYPAHQMNHS